MDQWFVFPGILLAFTIIFYSIIGVLLAVRRHKKSIRYRSPMLLSLSHWALLCETCLFSLMISRDDANKEVFLRLYQSLDIFLHYAYYYPYLLRCHRLHFIFKANHSSEGNDTKFNEKSYYAAQSWLIRIYILGLTPFILLGILIFVIPDFHCYVPIVYKGENLDKVWYDEAVYIFVCFIEELIFILYIYLLRNLEKDFNMSRELSLICCLWFCNSIFSMLPHNYWYIESFMQNIILMSISSIWPLYKSYRGESFDEALTIEVLQNMELLLLNRRALNTFDLFIDSLQESMKEKGKMLLSLWYSIEAYTFNPTVALSEEIDRLQQAMFLDRIEECDKEMDILKESILEELNLVFFTLFKETSYYRKLTKEIERNEIYMSRIMTTSLFCSLYIDQCKDETSLLFLEEDAITN